MQSARANDAAAESELADRYLSGRGLKGDYSVGLSYAKQAAAQGNARGEFLVGLCMLNGWATVRDENQAVEWWQKASDQGYPDAQYFLGEHFLGKGFGSGVGDQIIYVQLFTAHHELKQSAKGRALRDSAATGGYAPAELESGNADITDGKFDEGIALLQSAAAQGAPGAYIALGDFFCHPRRSKSERSDDFSHRQSRGFDSYQKAAAFDLGPGEEKVGDAYREGCGVPKDSEQAAAWYR
ncbi:MAG: tetratricopeptide repeat protein, partial [Terracidiphilus sp.]